MVRNLLVIGSNPISPAILKPQSDWGLFYLNMSNKSEAVKRWRIASKKRIIESMGGGCQICGYNKCPSALALHHLDPSQKEISLGSLRANPKNWDTVVRELRKCILLCHNCHSEVHAQVTQIPDVFISYNEEFTKYREINKLNDCPMCGIKKPIVNKYCSLNCAGKSSRRVDWDSVDLPSLLKNSSIVAIADGLGVSDAAVRKRMKKIGLK